MKNANTFSVEKLDSGSNTEATFLPNESCRIKSFTVIKVRRCKTGSSSESPLFPLWVSRYRHADVDDAEQSYADSKSRPIGSTIHIKGLPAFATKASLYRIFGNIKGKELEIDLITILPTEKESLDSGDNPLSKLQSHHLGYQHAYIAYIDTESINDVLEMPHVSDDYYFLPSNQQQMNVVWSDALDGPFQYNYSKRLEYYTTYMKRFDRKIKGMKRGNIKDAALPDEDGWVKVVKKRGRVTEAPAGKTAKNVDIVTERTARSKRKKKAPLVHFYHFRAKNERLESIKKLQAKFAEDREKIQEMKKQRKFRPY